MCTWKRALLTLRVMPTAPVTRNRVILPKLEKCRLFLSFSVRYLLFRWLPSWRSVPPRKLTASMPKTKLEANGDPCHKLLQETRTDKLKPKVRIVRLADPGCNSLPLSMSARHTAAGGEACVLCLSDCARVMSRCKVSALQSSFCHCYGTLWHAHASCLPESCSHAAM